MKKVVINTLLFLLLAGIVPGFTVLSWQSALLATLVYAVLKVIIGIPLKVVTFPFAILTFGLVPLLVNGLVLFTTDYFVSGISIESYGLAVFMAIVFSIVDGIFFKD